MSLLGTQRLSQRTFGFASLLLLAGGASSLLFFFEPGCYRFYPRCLFHQTTGLLCPGCGSLRALHQLLHGHIAAALHFNALLVLSIPAIGWVAVRSALRRLKGEPQSFGFHPAWLWGLLILGLLFGVLRNLPFARSAWLAP
jgi:hypothetical protein